MTNIGPEGDFNPKNPQAPRLVRSGANVRLVGIVSFVAGIGVSAIIVFVFFILIPKFSQTTVTQPAEFTSTVAPAGGDKPAPEESEALLRKFMQWQQKK